MFSTYSFAYLSPIDYLYTSLRNCNVIFNRDQTQNVIPDTWCLLPVLRHIYLFSGLQRLLIPEESVSLSIVSFHTESNRPPPQCNASVGSLARGCEGSSGGSRSNVTKVVMVTRMVLVGGRSRSENARNGARRLYIKVSYRVNDRAAILPSVERGRSVINKT